jgi:hypothetical protein
MADMELSLLNTEGKFVSELKQEGSTLSELGIQNGYTIKVEDKSGRMEMDANVEHYRINDDSYRQREKNFINFKKSAVLPHIAVRTLLICIH